MQIMPCEICSLTERILQNAGTIYILRDGGTADGGLPSFGILSMPGPTFLALSERLAPNRGLSVVVVSDQYGNLVPQLEAIGGLFVFGGPGVPNCVPLHSQAIRTPLFRSLLPYG